MNLRETFVSECCVEYCFGTTIDLPTNNRVLAAYRHLSEQLDFRRYGILDLVPSYTALALHLTPESPLIDDMSPIRQSIDEASDTPPQGREIVINATYDGEDLASVCQNTGLDEAELIALHSGRPYRIAMLGFRPFFPYLLGLDPRLHLPRRDTPRSRVPKGSIAIAAGQTGIYPEASPGGWHLIARTDFDAYETLRPGDTIIFRSLPC
jgi:5-oxoprolinase (ATP-hydrolysing) subunit B